MVSYLCLNLQAIPKKFSDNLKKKLPDVVTLRGPSGAAWTVGITTKEHTMFFKHGWQEFVKDHALGASDMLVFRYNGESQFDVSMFDGQSLCEKEASYFVRKCGHTEHENGCLSGRKTRKIACEEAQAYSKNGGCSVLEKSGDNNSYGLPSEEQVIITPTADKNELGKEANSTQGPRSKRLAARRGRPPLKSGVVNSKSGGSLLSR